MPVGFKASGGVKTLADARRLHRAGRPDHGPGLGVAGDVPLRCQRAARRPACHRRECLGPRGPTAIWAGIVAASEMILAQIDQWARFAHALTSIEGDRQRPGRGRAVPRRARARPRSITTSMIERSSAAARLTMLRRPGVADDRVERGGQRRRAFGVSATTFDIGLDPGDALLGEDPGTLRAGCPTRGGRRPSPAGTCSARGCPARRRSRPSASLPNTRAATWFTDSHSTGLTLPGMIDEPGCSSGRRSSASPADGPLASRRMSLAILVSATASPRSPADASASAPWPPWWTIGLAAGRSGRPVSLASAAITAAAKPAGALMPVPTAVPPSGSSPSTSTSAHDRASAASSSPGPGVGFLANGHRRGVHEVRASGLHDVGGALGQPA